MTGPALDPKKSLGQHFLHDQHVLGRIADLATAAGVAGVVEIGPGTGNLTEHLLARLPRNAAGMAPLWLLEVDRRTPAVLSERFGPCFSLRMGDAADVDWPALLTEAGQPASVVGNLPYYAALPILFALLDSPVAPQRIVVMVQKEVADRMAARPSTPDRGQISAKIQLRADVDMAFRVGRGAFQPPPNVESTVVVLKPRPCPWPLPAWPEVSQLITDAFAQRRKTMVNSLALAGWPDAVVKGALRQVGLDAQIRAEAVPNAAWAQLSVALAGQRPTPRL